MNLYDTLVRNEIKQSRCPHGGVILTKDKVTANGTLKERHVVMFTPTSIVPLRLADECS